MYRAALLCVWAALGCQAPSAPANRAAALTTGDCDATAALCLIVDAAAAGPTHDGSAAQPYRRITDALARARAFRAGNEGLIGIAVRAGTYVGTFGDNADGAHEDLPLVFNVPNLEVHGVTSLPLDAAGRPLRPLADSPQTVLTHDGLLANTCLTLAFIVVEPAASCDGAGACGPYVAPDGTRISGLTLLDGTGGLFAIMANRTIDLSIRQVWVDAAGGGAWLAFASGTVEEMLVTGSGYGLQADAGNADHPAHVVFSHNRSIGNVPTGLNLYALTAVDWVQHYLGGAQRATLQVAPTCRSGSNPFYCSEFHSSDCGMPPGNFLSAEVRGNELQGDGVGLRLWLSDILDEPSSVDRGHLVATVEDNLLTGTLNYGLDINGGFTPRDQDPLTIDLDMVLSGNQMHGGRAPTLIAFQALQALFGSPYFAEQPLQHSTYRFTDLDGELGGIGFKSHYDWDNPDCDPDLYERPYLFVDPAPFIAPNSNCPAGAAHLGNRAYLNGVPLPVGARLSPLK
jgi:hypothetical protein